MTEYFNRTSEKALRRRLRRQMTPAESKLWAKLRGKQLVGFRFRRQYSVGPFVLDFYCPELKLAIEVDGDSHFQPGADHTDQRRQAYVENFGICFVRFTNVDVHENVDGVLERLVEIVQCRGRELTPL